MHGHRCCVLRSAGREGLEHGVQLDLATVNVALEVVVGGGATAQEGTLSFGMGRFVDVLRNVIPVVGLPCLVLIPREGIVGSVARS